MPRRPIRIANCSGYLGDRPTALDEVLAGDPVDVVMGDYLAEITLAALAAAAQRGSGPGWVQVFLDQLRPHLAAVHERGIKVVTNAGGFDPAGLAAAVRGAAAEAGVPLRVAHVEGDDVLPRLADLAAAGHDLAHLDTGAALATWGAHPFAANAYLGGFGIAAALAAGADVVVAGRVTDASLTAGPAAWWHGWTPDDHGPLAGAVTAGHVVECGPHATGGNFSGFAQVPGMLAPGFPVAEVAADGSSVITKHARDGGTVTVDTVTAQLVYEIQGPHYLNPDVTVHLDTVRVHQEGPDRVVIGPVTGSPPPPTAKVAVFAPIGWEISQLVFCTAPDVAGKVELLRTQLTALLPGVDQLEVTALGTEAVDPVSQWAATVPIRVIATAADRAPLEQFPRVVGSLYLQGYPGFHHDGHAQRLTGPWPRVDYWPALLPAELVPHRVVLDDGTVRTAPSSTTSAVLPRVDHPEPTGVPDPGWPRVPLGRVAHARSGDKGGNVNVGVWVPDDAAWPWLRDTLGSALLRELLPEAAGLPVVRHEFPHLRAVHLVVHGLLGTGGSASLRVDQVGKSVGEYLRSRHVAVPAELLAVSGG